MLRHTDGHRGELYLFDVLVGTTNARGVILFDHRCTCFSIISQEPLKCPPAHTLRFLSAGLEVV